MIMNLGTKEQIDNVNSNIPKFFKKTVTTSSIATNNSGGVNITLPSSYTEIIAIIPVSIEPQTTWNSVGQIASFDTKSIVVQNCGNTAQAYKVTYYVIYK